MDYDPLDMRAHFLLSPTGGDCSWGFSASLPPGVDERHFPSFMPRPEKKEAAPVKTVLLQACF